jgi:hypothetical protein
LLLAAVRWLAGQLPRDRFVTRIDEKVVIDIDSIYPTINLIGFLSKAKASLI